MLCYVNENIKQRLKKTVKSSLNNWHNYYIGRLGLPLKGHPDDSKYHPKIGEYSTCGAGDFAGILKVRVGDGDNMLEKHLKNSSKKSSYTSKISQNDLNSCCGKFIAELFVKK